MIWEEGIDHQRTAACKDMGGEGMISALHWAVFRRRGSLGRVQKLHDTSC